MSREKQLVHTNMDLNNNVIESTALSSVGPPALSMLVADSGATSHFVTIKAPIINRTRTTKPLAITTANGAVIYSSHTAELNLPDLPLTARICHVVPHLGDFSLISLGQFVRCGVRRHVHTRKNGGTTRKNRYYAGPAGARHRTLAYRPQSP